MTQATVGGGPEWDDLLSVDGVGAVLAASLVTGIPGSSDYFESGVVTYANRAKEEWLGVPAPLLAAHGAVIGVSREQPLSRIVYVVTEKYAALREQDRYAVAAGRRVVFATNNDSAYLAALDLVAAGKLSPVIDSVLPLSEVAEAHRRLEARGEVIYGASFVEWFAEEARRIGKQHGKPHGEHGAVVHERRPGETAEVHRVTWVDNGVPVDVLQRAIAVSSSGMEIEPLYAPDDAPAEAVE